MKLNHKHVKTDLRKVQLNFCFIIAIFLINGSPRKIIKWISPKTYTY